MQPILEIKHLKKSFGGLAVTDDVSIALYRGDRVALIGPNGAGKTTLVNLITGHIAPDSGEVRLNSDNIAHLSATARVNAGLVRSFQVTRLFPETTVLEHIALTLLQREKRTSSMFGNFRAMPDILNEAHATLEQLGIDTVAEKLVSEIAYGQQRLVEMAIALSLKPRVLLLDEPAAGVPQSETSRIEEALSALPADLAVLMIDHDMDLVFRFAKRVIVLAAGQVIFDGTPQDVTRDARVRSAYLGSYANDSSHA